MNVTNLLVCKRLLLHSLFISFLSGQVIAEPLTTSFDLVKGIIIVKAEMEGEVSNFILDTGSPMMILNEKNENHSDQQANSLNGSLQGAWKKIHTFSWAGVHKFNLKALSIDITHLEHLTERKIRGLIGYDFFGNFDLMLDFQNQVATLVPGNYVARIEKWQLKSALSFELEGHLPVIEAKIGDVQLRLGLDTGAGANLLDIKQWENIAPKLLSPSNNTSVVGLGLESTSIVAAHILETTVAGNDYRNMRYVFSDISSLKNLTDNDVDGLLGFPFFESGKFTINYGQKVISFWE